MVGAAMFALVGVVVVMAFYMTASLLFLKTSSSARYHIVLCIALVAYSLGYLMEISAQDIPAVIAALRVENLGIAAIGPFYLLSMMQLCDSKLLRRWMGMVGMGYVLVMFLFVFTNDAHHLYYTSYDMYVDGWTRLILGRGPLFFVNQVLSMGMAIAGFYMVVRRCFQWTRTMRRRMFFIILGCISAGLGNLLNVAGVLGGTVDIMPFAFCLSLVFFNIGVSRNSLYELSQLGATQAVQTMDDAMVVLDADGGLIYHNNAAAGLFPPLAGLHSSAPVTHLAEWPDSLRGGFTEGEASFVEETPAGPRHFRCTVSRVGNTGGWCIVMRNVTETVVLTQRLEELADTDALTKIANRRHFIEQLEYELKRIERYNEPATLIMFDLDFFKQVNDTYGHSVGDEVLISITAAVQGVLRNTDLFGRYGGEEFLVLCPSTGEAEAAHLAERIRETISQTTVHVGADQVRVHASLGVAQITRGAKVDELINRVDAAMYLAKSDGRNRVRRYTGEATA